MTNTRSRYAWWPKLAALPLVAFGLLWLCQTLAPGKNATPPPPGQQPTLLAASADPAAAASHASGPSVWVNTQSRVYHLPGSRWYRRTSHGQLMPLAEAQAAGYRLAENGQ